MDQKPRQIAALVLRQRRAKDSPQPASAGKPVSKPSPTASARESFTETLIDRALAEAALSPPDRRLCMELVYGVVRWQAALDWLIARKSPGRVQKTVLQDLLRLGLYQLFWLDRIPAHAAVYETVEQARHAGFGAQAGFVNALLRGYLREAAETKETLTALKLSQPALGWSHPEWLVQRWQTHFGAEATQRLLEWNNTPPKTFARINTLKTCAEKLLPQWREENVEYDFFTRDWIGENLVFELKSFPPLTTLKSFRDGCFYVQDPSTLLAVRELSPQPGETILDFCAAPGGKATLIAQWLENQGRVFAHDVSPERMKLIEENIQRLGTASVTMIPDTSIFAHPSSLDRVLVDAPCSNTGVMRRRVDLRWRLQPAEILRLQAVQVNLLQLASQHVRPGGILVYSTCSLEPEENEAVVKQFLEAASGFAIERERRLTPFAEGVDGTYVARMRRT